MEEPRRLGGRYELGSVLGRGGMAEVHLAHDTRLGRTVAVKTLRADLARDPSFQARFRREAQSAASLNHPAIVAVYDTGEDYVDGVSLPYIVMEYVDGRTLRDMVKTQGPLSGKRAMEVMADVSAALDFSHRHGIVHRDVKPANVMITRSGAVKVMDFGIARAVHDGQAAVTQTAAVIGTAQYLSPEQARGEAVDGRSDVYASGCVLFELLTGEPPFTGDSPVAVAYQHVREDPKSPSSLNPNVTPALDAIVLKAMAKGPANRYQSAAEMRADLVRVLSGQRPSAPAVMTPEDRTAVLNQSPRTEVVSSGRHRPSALRDEQNEYDPLAEEDAERRAKRKKATMVTLVVLLCIAVIALAAWITSSLLGDNTSAGSDKVAVPGVTGKTLAAAKASLEEVGLKYKIDPVPCQPGENGAAPRCTADDIDKVFAIDPAAGTSVPKLTEITLTYGTSPDQIAVPDVTGMTPQEAQAKLTADGWGFVQGQDTVEVEENARIGKVAQQNPQAGVKAAKGAVVTVLLGKGPDTVQLADVTGQPVADATATLDGAGFKVSVKEADSAAAQGEVLSQSPNPGRVAKGSTITLTVSKGNQISMPEITGMTVEQARTKLNQQGWNGELTITDKPAVTDITKNGKIQSQDPKTGAAITKNQRINITVAEFKVGGPTS